MNRNYGFTSREMEYLQPVEKKLGRMKFWAEFHHHARTTSIAILVLVVLLAAFLRWSNWHTTRAEAAYDKYERCVLDTYGVSATKFYQVYGRVANCN